MAEISKKYDDVTTKVLRRENRAGLTVGQAMELLSALSTSAALAL